MPVLSSGFDHAFFYSFLVGIVIIVMALCVRQEIHPDYRDKPADSKASAGLI